MTSTYLWRTPTYPWMESDWDELLVNNADPYLIWADASGGLPNDLDQMPVLVELATNQTIQQLRNLVSHDGGIAAVTSLYPSSTEHGVNFRFCTIHARRKFFLDPAAYGVFRYVIGWARIPIAEEIPPQIVWEQLLRRPVIAVIDDGLPFLHDAYRYTDSQSQQQTRMMRFKSLDKKFAIELKQDQIKLLLAENEGVAYKKMGYSRVERDASHGSHLMDVAAGKSGVGIAGGLPVLAVQLPTETVIDSSGGSLAVHAADAFRYVLNQVPENQPVVTCMSYGIHAGPHDGSSILERALDEMLLQKPNAVLVIPAGNNYLARGHARLVWPSKQLQNLQWRVQPDDLTDSFCELWFDDWQDDASDQSPFEISLSPPQANDKWHSSPGVYAIYKAQYDARPIASLVLQRLQQGGKSRWMALLCIAGTVKADGAPHGLWQIKIKSKNESQSMAVDAWIERDGAVFGGNSGGLQSYFEDTSNETVIGVGTLNGIATGSEPIVVGAYVEQTGQVSSYSASGADYFAGATKQPLCSAVGDDDADMRGVKAAGTRSGTYCWLSGTSVATAKVTRRIANIWAANSTLTRDQVKAKLVENLPPIQAENSLRVGVGKV
jgi:hypothetical protein